MWILSAFFVGFVLGSILVFIWMQFRIQKLENDRMLIEKERLFWEESLRKMEETFQSAASRTLQSNSDELVKRASEQMKFIVDPLENNLRKMEEFIRELEQKREGAYSGLHKEIQLLRDSYQNLQMSTQELVNALKSIRSRGQWGELQLRRVVELAGMLEYVDFEMQVSNDADGVRPDMLIHLPNGGKLPVDAKTPFDAYLQSVSITDENKRKQYLQKHAKALRSHISTLSKKSYWQSFTPSPEFVVLFVPNEAMLSAALQVDPDLLDYAFQKRVILTSPITLLALLKTVGWGWTQNKVAENARTIAEQGNKIYKQLKVVTTHLIDLQKNLGKTVESYNKVVSSLESRLVPSVKRLRQMGIGESDLLFPDRVEKYPRSLENPFEDS